MGALTIIVARAVTRPLRSLSRAAQRVADGDLGARSRVSTSDEIGILASTFNSMVGRIQNWQRYLEQQVTARTAELRNSHSVLEAIIEGTPDCVFLKDWEGRYRIANSATARSMGKASADEIVGRTDSEVLPPEQAAQLAAHDSSAMNSGTARSYQESIELEGDRRTFLTMKAPWRDAQGEVIGVIGIARDITEHRQAEEALEEGQRLRQILLDNMPCSAILVRTEDRTIVAANQVALAAGASLGTACYAALWGRDEPCLWCLVDDDWTGERAMQKEVPRDGQVLEYQWVPISETLHMALAFDITERKQAEDALRASEAKYADLYDDAPDMFVSLDMRAGEVVDCNKALVVALGYTKNEIVGRPMVDFYHQDSMDDARRAFKAFSETGEVRNAALQLRRRDGSKIDVILNVSAVRDGEGKIVASRSVLRDITDIRRAQDEIHRLNEELEERVRQRTAELEVVNQELESFAYSVSHDLRAPLRAIDGFSQALVEDCHDQIGAQGKAHLERVQRGARDMSQLIDDLLGLARVSRAEMRHEAVDLSQIARRIREQLVESEPERRVSFTIGDGVVAFGDAHLLALALQNLLANAWKFTGKRDEATVEFGAIDDEGGATYFIRDDGVGFDMAYAEKLFGVFQRLHTAEEFPGTGIGLATVQRIVRRHGGRVWGEGMPEAGATFYFTLGRWQESSDGI
jgi:PAS domain S-box-containing protein